MRINLKLFTTFSKIGNKNHDFMRVSEALIQFNCQTRGLMSLVLERIP